MNTNTNMNGLRIHEVEIRDFRCISHAHVDVSEGGVLVEGPNGKGKTSFLGAVMATLMGRGISADAVKVGADRAEIRVDLGDVTVRRVIPRDGTPRVIVRRADGSDVAKPAAYLAELLGGGSLDPLDIYLASPKERKRKILAAVPARVTVEQLRKWVPTLPDDFPTDGHALEVLEQLHEVAYKQRADANASAKQLRAAAVLAARVSAEAQVPPGAQPVADAEASERAASRSLAQLEMQADAATRASAKAEEGWRTVASQREEAKRLRAAAVPSGQAAVARADADRLAAERDEIVAKLRDLEAKLSAAVRHAESTAAQVASARADHARAAQLDASADALEQALSASSFAPVPEGDIARARADVEAALHVLGEARAAERARKLVEEAAQANERAKGAETEADRLDRIVCALRDDAPTSILTEANAIRGLRIAGDDVYLDNVNIATRSGAEQLTFAVEIAKRAHTGSARLLVVDGLERLDPEQLERFLRSATSGGWQVLGSRVGPGESVKFQAIEGEV
jgi:chemotaxis protein histidine kinase CheA